jgi:PAS domain S-box-containing protein
MERINTDFRLLKDFARFLRNDHLCAFSKEVLENYIRLNIPLLTYYNDLPEEKLFEITREGIADLLSQFISGIVIQKTKDSIQTWKENKIPGIPRESVSAKDITLINKAAKNAFYTFIPGYTSDLSLSLALVTEIDDFYTYNETLAIDAFAEIKQDQLRESERQLKEAHIIASLGSWEYFYSTGKVNWSEELYKIYGLSPSEPITLEKIFTFILPEYIDYLKENVRIAQLENGHFTQEYKIKRADGSVRILYEKGYSRKDEEGNTILKGTLQDITEIRQIEASLKESETRFRLIAENSSDVISINSLKGIIHYISPSAENILGFKPGELIGTNAFDLYHPDDQQLMEDSYRQIIATRENNKVTFRCRHKNGNYIWFESIGKTIRDDNGNPVEIQTTNRDVTENITAEQRIRENEELLSGVLNSSLSGIQVFRSIRDEQGAIINFEWIMANDAIEKLFGLKKEFLIGKYLLDIFPGVDKEGIFKTYIETVNGQPKHFRQHYNQENYDHWFNLYTVPFRDGFILSSEDITAQIQAEDELKKVNADLEIKVQERTQQLETQMEDLFSIFMQAPVPFAVLQGQDLRFELVNDQYLNLLGKSSEIIGKPGREAVPEIVSQGLWDLLENVFTTGFPYYGHEFPILISRPGEEQLSLAYFNFAATPISDPEGVTTRLMLVAADVSRQVQARQEVKAREEHLKTVLEALPEIAWTATPEGEVNYYNSRWKEYAGQDKKWQSVIHPDDFSGTAKDWLKSIESGEIFGRENRFRSAKDDSYRWFLVRALPVRDYTGKIEIWVGTCTDIHENKLIREQLAEINNELLSKNKELTKINIDLDNFIYTASHDLKAPVSNIEGLVGTLRDILKPLNNQVPEKDVVMDMIERSILRFKSTIQDLTEISKIQKNFYEDIEEINLSEIFEDVLLTIDEDVKSSGAEITSEMCTKISVRFSRINLKSILYNLLSNAIKYRAPDRPPLIRVTCTEEKNMTVISVKDNGLGIREEHRDKVFSMFKRFHDHVAGTGVGLYIVKRIVENSGGRIQVLSQEGQGSEFRVYLK